MNRIARAVLEISVIAMIVTGIAACSWGFA